MYTTESSLVSDFVTNLRSSQLTRNSCFDISFEFPYYSGRTDVIAINQDNELFAFEAKLQKWRSALDQAYKNTYFAHYSYVVLPKDTAKIAMKYWKEFDIRSVGICSLDGDSVIILLEASKNDPLQEKLTEKAIDFIKRGKDNARKGGFGEGCTDRM